MISKEAGGVVVVMYIGSHSSAGGGAVWGGVVGVVPGVGPGDVAHGALTWRFLLVISRAFCCGADSDSLVGMACMDAGF